MLNHSKIMQPAMSANGMGIAFFPLKWDIYYAFTFQS